MFQYKKLTTKERITRMKIEMQEEQPFWSRLIMDLIVQEDTKGILPDYGGMGIDARGNLFYKNKFVEGLDDAELKFVLAHEVGHIMLGHLLRIGNRDPMAWNFAADLIINTILRDNNFTAPGDCVIPDHDNIFELGKVKIVDVDKKTAEQIYDEFPKGKNKCMSNGEGNGEGKNGKGGGYKGQFDHHMHKKLSEAEKKEIQNQWNDKIIDACAYSRHKGNVPAGLDRYIKDILEPKVNWKHLLYKYITNTIPVDFTWSRPSKKSASVGCYMPSVLRETVELAVHVDTSGSISQKELTEFLTEVISIARSFQHVHMTLIECDCEVQQVLEVSNGNIEKIKNMQIKGGGGTSHHPVWKHIEENIPNCKLLVSLTDGYSDIEQLDPPGYGVIWVICSGGVEDDFSFGQTIRLEE